jgi:cytidylate kinase
MSHESSSTHPHAGTVSQLVDKAFRHWEARRQAAAAQRNSGPQTSPAFTVTLSREAGTQGTLVAQEVGRILGWHVYDHELLEKIAQDMGLRTSLLESVDERRQSWLLEVAQGLMSVPSKGDRGPLVSDSGFVHHLVRTVLAVGVHGECVIVGRGAAFILPAETTLRVRLVGPVSERIAALSRILALSESDGARQVRALDRARNDFVQDHFQKDPTDPGNYDLILNAPRLSAVQSAEVIVETLLRLRARGIDKTTAGPA